MRKHVCIVEENQWYTIFGIDFFVRHTQNKNRSWINMYVIPANGNGRVVQARVYYGISQRKVLGVNISDKHYIYGYILTGDKETDKYIKAVVAECRRIVDDARKHGNTFEELKAVMKAYEKVIAGQETGAAREEREKVDNNTSSYDRWLYQYANDEVEVEMVINKGEWDEKRVKGKLKRSDLEE